ncbi:MAG: sodium/solute symporter [Chitinophagaceae bacterium]
MSAAINNSVASDVPPRYFNWSQLPAVPGHIGFAGAFAGVSNGALLVAGGANFPDGAPWTGARKIWYNEIYVLENAQQQWKLVGHLPQTLGYGVAVTWKDGVICIGGSNAEKHTADAFILRYVNGKINTEQLPSLPVSLANACGAVIGNVLYVAGGAATPVDSSGSYFWSLDLALPAAKRVWNTLPSWPGPSRMMSVAGTQDGHFYLFGGTHVTIKDSTAQRAFLKDAYKYIPAKGWVRLPDLPEPVVAAPSPAYNAGQSHLLIFGGDNGQYFDQNNILKETHPGFSKKVYAFNTITESWSQIDEIATDKKADAVANPGGSTWAPVTTPLVVWNNSVILPSGEVRPGTRTPRVLVATPAQPAGSFKWLDWTVVGLYFVLLIGISVFVSRKMNNTTSDFFLGGGKIPWWAAGLSIFGSKLSALTFIAIPAKAYATNWVYFLSNMMIVAVAPIIIYFYLPYFRKLKITSVYEYLQVRFNKKVKLLGSINFVLFQVSRLGIVIYLPALVLSTVTGINIFICIIGTSLITTAYSVSGGIEAVIWTEVMQVGVLLGGALLSLLFIAHSVDGGWNTIFTESLSNDKLRVATLGWSFSEPVLWVVFLGGFLTQLVTYSSDQVVVQRYLTTSTEKEARQSIYTNAILVVPASLIFFSVGTALWVYFRHNPGQLNPHGHTDDIFPWFISQQLPAGLSGLVIAGLFAATMSTISSSMNSIATVVTTDFYQSARPESTDHQRFVFARRTTFVLGLLGCSIAIYLVYLSNASIWDQYLKIIGLFGGCLAGMFVAGIFFPRINSVGVLTGFIVSAVSLYFIQATGQVSFFLYPVFAIAICVLVAYITSLFVPSAKKSIA